MKVKYSSAFLAIAKKANVRIRKQLEEKIEIFSKDPYNLHLHNHPLKDKYQGYRSITITSDWRAIYQEIQIGEEVFAYFIALGTHGQLYR